MGRPAEQIRAAQYAKTVAAPVTDCEAKGWAVAARGQIGRLCREPNWSVLAGLGARENDTRDCVLVNGSLHQF
jgi:hypothetical protein